MELVPQRAESGGQLVTAGKSQIGIRRATPARFSREGRNHVGHAKREYPSTQTGAPVQDLTNPFIYRPPSVSPLAERRGPGRAGLLGTRQTGVDHGWSRQSWEDRGGTTQTGTEQGGT